MPGKRVLGPISATMAIDALREQCERVNIAKEQYHAEVALRDDLIRDLKSIRLPEKTIAGITKLSRDSIHRIAHSGSRTE